MSYLRAEGTIEEFGKKDELLLEPDDFQAVQYCGEIQR
jgi:hypothetical protein